MTPTTLPAPALNTRPRPLRLWCRGTYTAKAAMMIDTIRPKELPLDSFFFLVVAIRGGRVSRVAPEGAAVPPPAALALAVGAEVEGGTAGSCCRERMSSSSSSRSRLLCSRICSGVSSSGSSPRASASKKSTRRSSSVMLPSRGVWRSRKPKPSLDAESEWRSSPPSLALLRLRRRVRGGPEPLAPEGAPPTGDADARRGRGLLPNLARRWDE
mmetsp:Transcript_2401/g.10211  ORF Transcript_2401/g.10211 Transcript_2401/m.10211 type:complete len:213 (+) Transcript_2401:1820-2458(+)